MGGLQAFCNGLQDLNSIARTGWIQCVVDPSDFSWNFILLSVHSARTAGEASGQWSICFLIPQIRLEVTLTL